MVKQRKTSLVFAGILAICCGCGITSGTVVQKEFVPAHDEWEQTSTVVISVDPYMTIPIYGWVHYSDRYYFHLKAGDKTGRVTVSEWEYGQFELGQLYGVEK